MVAGVAPVAEMEIGLAVRFLVAVQQDGLGPIGQGLAAIERMLAALPVAGEIGEGAIRGGNGGVIPLDAPAHLGDEGRLGLTHGSEIGLREGVFRLQIGTDVGVQHRRIAHDGAPVFGAQPGIVLGESHAVDNAFTGAAWCARRLRRHGCLRRRAQA